VVPRCTLRGHIRSRRRSANDVADRLLMEQRANPYPKTDRLDLKMAIYLRATEGQVAKVERSFRLSMTSNCLAKGSCGKRI
jgi:hypothetical protein